MKGLLAIAVKGYKLAMAVKGLLAIAVKGLLAIAVKGYKL